MWQELTASAKSGGPPRVRNKHLAFGRTELIWRPSRRNPIIDPNRGNEQEIHFLAYVPYRGQYLLLYEFGWYTTPTAPGATAGTRPTSVSPTPATASASPESDPISS